METTKRIFYRDTSKFTRANLTKNESADWSPVYQQNNANSTFEKFSIMFQNTLNDVALIKIGEPSSKSTKKEMVIHRNIESYQRKAQTFQYLEGKNRR